MDLRSFCIRLGLEWDVARDAADKPVLEAESDEQVSCSYEDVELIVGDNGSTVGKGTIYVTSRRLIWVSADTPTSSLACNYRQISMHAVSRDSSTFSKPCVYIQLDEGSETMEDEEGIEDEAEEQTAELRLVPADEAQVELIFSKLCECSALNPDSDIEEEGGASLFFDEAEVLAGLPEDQRAAVLAARTEGALNLQGDNDDLDELMADDPERFEDEDDDEGEEDEQQTAAAGQPGAAGNGI